MACLWPAVWQSKAACSCTPGPTHLNCLFLACLEPLPGCLSSSGGGARRCGTYLSETYVAPTAIEVPRTKPPTKDQLIWSEWNICSVGCLAVGALPGSGLLQSFDRKGWDLNDARMGMRPTAYTPLNVLGPSVRRCCVRNLYSYFTSNYIL